MSKAQIETRAKRILARATALGITKNGSPLVIDQARELLAAAEGHRSWHTLRAAQDPKPAQANAARVESAASAMLQALHVASEALNRIAHGADFDRVVDETGVTFEVLSAIRYAETGQRAGEHDAGKPTYDQLHRTLFEIGSQNPIWTEQPNIDAIVNEWLQSARDVLRMELNGAGDLVPKAAAAANEESDDHLTRAQRAEATEQGWNLFDAEGELQIQREDDQGIFPGDDEAWLFVIREAAKRSESAAAKALALLREHSPEEYRRIEMFDRKNDRLLPYQPKTSAGHPVDLSEVAEWVGLHHQVNFDTAGARQQEWIDRFAAAHEDDERFASYLVAESWGHIFIGKTESTVRWVFRLGGDDEGVVSAQILGELGRWTDLDRVAMDDIEESIYDNDVPTTFRQAWDSEVKQTLQLPSWATPKADKPEASTEGGDMFVEILQHRIRWHLRGDGAPTELPESAEEHIEQLIRGGFNQGELLVTSDDGETEHRGWWSIDKP